MLSRVLSHGVVAGGLRPHQLRPLAAALHTTRAPQEAWYGQQASATTILSVRKDNKVVRSRCTPAINWLAAPQSPMCALRSSSSATVRSRSARK
jgi:hypothetical protein